MDWLTFFAHPTAVTALSAVAGAATGAAVSARIAYSHWRKQRAYIDRKLLEDRRNERRHQAILVALRELAAVHMPSFGLALPEAEGNNEVQRQLTRWYIAKAALEARLTEAEIETMRRMAQNGGRGTSAFWEMRDFLVSLFD